MESELGCGSTFSFTVKVKPAAAGEQREQASWQPTTDSNRTHHILLVEDNEVNLKVALGVLAQLGYHHVDTAENGGRALEALAEKEYDLVLMDLSMPEKDGFETTSLLRSQPQTRINAGVPVVALTAHAMRGDRERCLAAGMNGYLSKPLEPKALDRMLAELWGNTTVSSMSAADGESRPEGGVEEVLDLEGLVKRLLGDRELAGLIISELAGVLPGEMALLEEQITAGRIDEAERQAHKLKGAVGNVGAVKLQRLLGEMELAGKSKQPERLRELLVLVQAVSRELEDALSRRTSR